MSSSHTRRVSRALGCALAWVVAASLVACGTDRSPQAEVTHAQELVEAGKPGEARVRMKALLVEHPDNVDARLLLARIALEGGEVRIVDEELQQLTAAQQQDPREIGRASCRE